MKLRIENLARIKQAEVEVKNLTLFVGQNSTHKSYMAHTIYELLRLLDRDSDSLTKEKKNMLFDLYKEADFLLKYIIEKREIKEQNSLYTYIILLVDGDNKKFYKLIDKLCHLVNKVILKLINKSFNNNSNILEKLFFEQDLEMNSLFRQQQYEFRIYKKEDDLNNDLILYMILSDFTDILFKFYKDSLSSYYDIQYFPASRTGFVLAFDEIVSGLLRDKYRGQSSSAKLTKPTIDFITNFSDIKTSKFNLNFLDAFGSNKNNSENKAARLKLVNFLQNNIIKGKIEEKKLDDNYRSFYLKTKNNTKLDLHLASSATLETLPFVIFLRNNTNIKKTLFVIEEPEAHLHPKAQVQMAKFLVLLSNTGAKVIVTTHSDYILNEINNCIKLSTINKEDDFSISKDNVSAYLFKNEENETTVNQLKIDKYGIANDNFDEVLDELLDRSSELTETIMNNE